MASRVCFGCGLIFPEADAEMVEDDAGDAVALACPDCGGWDTEGEES